MPTGAVRKFTDLINLHTSATRPKQTIDKDWFRAVHIKGNGWSVVGYNIIIWRDGSKWQNLADDVQGINVKGFNSRSVGICLVGGLNGDTGKPENNYTAAQMETLYFECKRLHTKFPLARVTGHRTLSPDTSGDGIIQRGEYLKECPCFNAPSWAEYCGLPSWGKESSPKWKPSDNGLPSNYKPGATLDVQEAWRAQRQEDATYKVYKNNSYQFGCVTQWSAQRAVDVCNWYEGELKK